jgi:broad specificity phosphatase PhoE
VTRIYLVRHGRAAAGWDVDPDPGLDDVGERQAVAMSERLTGRGPMALVSSPLRRCQETSRPLARAWDRSPLIDARVAEIPSPAGVVMEQRVTWLRNAMRGTWDDLGVRYTEFRDQVVAAVVAAPVDTVIVSHFVAINAVIGAATGDDRLVIRSLDNCSVTVVEVVDGVLALVEGGHEADTLIR